MTNHLASLLGNLDLRKAESVVTSYLLMIDDDETDGFIDAIGETAGIFGEEGIALGEGDVEITSVRSQLDSKLASHDFALLTLPPQLTQLHLALFPEKLTFTEKQKHLYSYMRLLHSLYPRDVLNYDSRLTYDISTDISYLGEGAVNLVSLYNDLKGGSQRQVADMLAYQQERCTARYTTMWQQHFNSMYQLGALLLAFTERVNLHV